MDNKTKTKSCSLQSKTRKSAAYEDRKFLDNNCSTLAMHHRKKQAQPQTCQQRPSGENRSAHCLVATLFPTVSVKTM